MNPILEAISNNVSALPAVIPTAQPGSGSGKAGGFASTLAAAQGLSTTSPSPAVSGPDGNRAGSTAAASLSGKAVQSPQPRRPLNGLAPAIANMVRADSLTGQMAGLTEGAAVQNSMVTSESGPAISAMATSVAASNEPVGLSSPGSAEESMGGIAGQSSAEVLPPNQISDQANGQEPSLSNNARISVGTPTSATVESNASSPGSAAGGRPNSFADEPPSLQPTLLAENLNPPAVSFANEPPSPDTITPPIQRGGSRAGGIEPGLSESAAQSFQAATESTTAAAALLADASSQAGPVAGVQSSLTANLPMGHENSSEGGVTVSVSQNSVLQNPVSQENALQNNVPPAPPVGILLSGVVSAQAPASAGWNAQAQPLPGRAAARFIIPKVSAGVATPSVRGPNGDPNSTPTSAVAADSETVNGLPLTSQTPFSIFFSSPGPGTESAASSLPKMILPVASAATHGSLAAAPGASAGAATLQTAGLQSNLVQTAAAQTSKDSLSASSSLQAGALLRGEPSVANAPVVSAQVAVVASAAVATATPIAVPLIGQAAVPADSLPKQETLPGAAVASPASQVPAAPQALPTVPVGPVQVAQLVNRMGQSEMRVGMNTSAFGNVEIRTLVHASDVGLTIGSEKGDLRGFLANDLPAIANTLQQQNLRLNNVNFMQGFAFSNNSSGGGDSQQRSFVPPPASPGFIPGGATPEDSGEILPTEFGGAGNSLSILA